MSNLKELWDKRFRGYIGEISKYARLIVNDHLSAILFILFAFFAIYYHNLLNSLEEMTVDSYRLPLLLVCLVVIGVVFMVGRPLWLTKEADKSYLFPRGREWDDYWLKGTLVSLIGPIILLVLVGLLLYPFVQLISSWTKEEMSYFLGSLALFKWLSHMLTYLNIYGLGLAGDKKLGRMSHTVLVVLVYLVSLLVPSNWHMVVIAITLGAGVGYVIWVMSRRDSQQINFEYVVEEEKTRTSNFYKMIGYFADVPQQASGFKSSKLSDFIIGKAKSLSSDRYSYLYLRLIGRSDDYRGIWLRVMVFIGVFLMMSDNIWLASGLVLVGHLMTVMQLVNVINQYKTNPYQSLYSTMSSKVKAFQKTASLFLIIQSIFYILVYALAHGGLSNILIIVVVSILGAYLVLITYVPSWAKKKHIV